uniref:Uncharacterized protein n=1 Tax=Cyclopterus lumpus TaxID=8103 RepID=A0A8C2ZR66_CYCLU
ILNVLTSYISAVETVAGFQSCSELESHTSKEVTHPITQFEEELMCHHILDRLFSFSIVSARVFAVGDPAHHTEGSAQKCM